MIDEAPQPETVNDDVPRHMSPRVAVLDPSAFTVQYDSSSKTTCAGTTESDQ